MCLGDKMYSTDKLVRLRKAKKITLKEMGEYLNVTSSYYSQIEKKKKRLYYDMAIKIANYFGKKPDELFL